MRDFESSDLSEREKLALRIADRIKLGPWGLDEPFLEQAKQHFSDAEICEIGYVVMAYGGAHNLFSFIGEEVFDDAGNKLTPGDDGFPLVFDTKAGVTHMQSPEQAALDGPLPARGQAREG